MQLKPAMAQEEQLPQSKELFKEKAAAPRPLTQIVPQLSKYGGFEFIKTIVDGTENMDPTKKARKAMFLEEEESGQGFCRRQQSRPQKAQITPSGRG